VIGDLDEDSSEMTDDIGDLTREANTPGKYQIMPPLAPEELDTLRASVETYGVLSPILVDEDSEIIDGHTRQAIANELGVPCPQTIRAGLSEDEKIGMALTMNLGGATCPGSRNESWPVISTPVTGRFARSARQHPPDRGLPSSRPHSP
jgi:hypothetical protein